VRAPWESEKAAFGFLLRVLAICAVIIVLVLALRAIF
jgi:hypothetical protein